MRVLVTDRRRPGWVEESTEEHSSLQGAVSLRCEPALTGALDAMAEPPKTRAEALPIVEEWQAKERSLWPPDYREQVALAITCEYVLLTVRTRRYREQSYIHKREPERLTFCIVR